MGRNRTEEGVGGRGVGVEITTQFQNAEARDEPHVPAEIEGRQGARAQARRAAIEQRQRREGVVVVLHGMVYADRQHFEKGSVFLATQ